MPFFSQRQDPSTINHYSLQATDILPFLNNSSKQDTYVANGRLKIVTIHKEHNGFAKLQVGIHHPPKYTDMGALFNLAIFGTLFLASATV